MAKGVGFTIHAGWIPQLLKGRPSKKFSTSKSSRGITVKGYNREFVKQVQSLGEERAEQLNSGRIITKIGAAAVGGGTDKALMAFAPMLLRLGKKKDRAVSWRDMAESAKDYKNRSKAMAIRGNHIWYQLGRTGPKEMAQTLLDKQNFKFEKAEKWYNKYKMPFEVTAHQQWASKTLGLDPTNVNQNINVQDVEVIGDVSEETIIREEGLGSRDAGIAKELGMQKPAQPEGGARGRDISSKAFGDIESTEMLSEKAHHGLPDDYIKKAADKKGEVTVESWTTFMNDTVLKTWNDYTRKVIDNNKGDVPTAIKKIKESPSHEMSSVSADMSLNTLRKMRHEVSIADIQEQSQEFGSSWKEGIPISERSESGMRSYASSDLSLGDDLQFSLNGVNIIRGASHTGALIATNNRELSANAVSYYITQQNHFAHARMNNEEGARTINGITSQGFDRVVGATAAKTNVSFSVKAGKKWLDEVAKTISKHVEDAAKMRSSKIQKQLSTKASSYQDIFWALPYISIEEGIYKGK